MNPESLLRQFEVMADAPNGVQKLRELILQLAVRGTLVPQDPSDEPASVLLERAKDEKRKLIKKRQTRDRRFPRLAEGEIPYVVPESWVWARLDDVGYELGQKVPDRRFTYIDVSSIDNARGVISSGTQVLEPGEAPSRARKLVRCGTVIYSTVRPYLLNVTVVERDFVPEPIASTAFAVLHPLASIDPRYLFYYLRSQPFVTYVEAAMTGMAYPAINDGKFYRGVVPLPPLPEQRRIVAKVDELMALCDRLEARQQRRAEARARLNRSALHHLTAATDDAELAVHWQRLQENFHLLYDAPETVAELRQAVLQLAVRGKLVPQDPRDEPASVLLERIADEKERLFREGKIGKPKVLARVGEEEIPFTVPEGWEWVRLSMVADHRLGKMLDKAKNRGTPYPYLRNTNVQWLRFDLSDIKEMRFRPEELEEYEVRAGDLLVCEGGEPGRGAVWNDHGSPMMFQKALHRVRPNSGVDAWYILYNLQTSAASGALAEYFTGATIKHMTGQSLARFVLPLPPLREQRRIVAKVDELMALCDRLEARLTAVREKSAHLAASVVHHLAAA